MLNKTIWILWLQGWDNAPWLIKQVAQSWEINNPDWKIEYVTLDNLHEYVCDIEYIYDKTKEIAPPAKSDIIRLSLLKNHGGVWADATMLCMQPLSFWVEELVAPAGLWMYHGPGGGLAKIGPASWFIIATKDALIIKKWKSACDQYWQNRTKTDDYFWLDRLFRNLFDFDIEFRNSWNLVPYLYCNANGQAHALASPNLVLMGSNNQELKNIFQEKPPYALKLWWIPWQKKFPDINSPECKNSNGYFAIQMSKRKFTFKHKITSKAYFQKIYFLKRSIKKLLEAFK